MADLGLKEFEGRLRRVERIHRRGGGFEADGTLGRSFYTAQEHRRTPLPRMLLLVLGCALLLKAVLFMQIGPIDYADRVERLATGSQVERVGAYIMQADSVTVWLSGVLENLFKAPV